MEPNETGLSSYYHQQRHQSQPPPQPPQHHQHHQSPTAAATVTNSPSNGILSNTTERAPHMVYPHSVPSAVSSPLDTVRRKRGRPRKYGTPEQAAAAKRVSSSSPSSSSMPILPPKKKEQSLLRGASSPSSFSKKSQLAALGNAGQGFTPHIITVAAGEDVAQKIMLFMQQSKREICILSASGSISNPSLRQPATSGGNITYELSSAQRSGASWTPGNQPLQNVGWTPGNQPLQNGRFDILSLTGSYVRTELGGRTGGLSVCLSSTDGQIIGGGVGGPMRAAGPVQVIVGTFLIDTKKDHTTGVKGDTSVSKLPSPVAGASVSNVGFPVRGNDDHQSVGGSQFMIQPRGISMSPSRSTDWRGGTDARSNANYDLAGRAAFGAQQSPENGDYE